MGEATIKDVARAAGVSIATVSRVINQNYAVSPELEGKVRAAIEALQYYPNSVARSLKKESTFTIGYLVSDISNSFFTTVSKAIEDVIQAYHYNLIVCSTDDRQEREAAYLRLLMEKKVDGIILNTTGLNNGIVVPLSQRVPMVLSNRKVEDPAFKGDFVDSDNRGGSYALAMHLISLGHRRIGVICGPRMLSTGYERMEGFCSALRTIGVQVGEGYPYLYDGGFTMEGGYQGAAHLMALPTPPTAVVIMNNSMVTGALKFFRAHQIDIPGTISVASYGDIINGDLLYVQPSTVTLNPWVIGGKLAELIVERIEKKNGLHNREIRYVPQLVPGSGVRAL